MAQPLVQSSRFISVALCTYNGGAYLREQLGSIAAQTTRVSELVVCDDGSTDDSLAITEQFRTSGDCPFEVRIFRNPATLGVTQNFARAVGLCRGELIFFADQDDVWLPNKVERLCRLFDGYPACGCAFSDAEVCDASLRPIGHGIFEAIWFTPQEQEKWQRGGALQVMAKHAIAAGTTAAFRASFRDLILPMPTVRTAHDIWTSTLIGCVAPVAFTTEKLVNYRVHGKNQVGMRRWNLIEQVAKAREQLQLGAFDHAVQLYGAMAARLREPHVAERFKTTPAVLRMLDDKTRHSKARDDMAAGVLRLPVRLPAIVRELLRGNYSKYSYGFKSVLQDLFLR